MDQFGMKGNEYNSYLFEELYNKKVVLLEEATEKVLFN